jgi:putative ABC transport system substrate-binding protein
MRRREFIAAVGGAALLRPMPTWAQQSARTHRIALVHASVPVTQQTEASSPGYRAFFSELRRLGHVEGSTLIVARYSAEGRIDRYPELARAVVQERPEVIWGAFSSRLVQQFKAITSDIPIVAVFADPVKFGLAASLSRPGGNVTGVTSDVGLDIVGKRIEFLKEVIPRLSRVGVLISDDLAQGHVTEAIKEAAHKVGAAVVGPPLRSPINEVEYRRVFIAMSNEKADALLLSDQPEHFTILNRETIARLGVQYHLPIIGTYRQYAEAGLLASYGVDNAASMRITAIQIDQILKGAFPGDIPIQQPTKFELVVNGRTARALGLTIPPTLLARADEVIE